MQLGSELDSVTLTRIDMSLVAHDINENVIRAGGLRSDEAETSPERAAFLAARCGKLTGSRMKDAMDFLKNGQPSAKRKDYMKDIIAERLTGLNAWHYVNPAMEFGSATEPEAKAVYEKLTGFKVLPGEVIDHPRIDAFAATPDGFIEHPRRLLEIKCPTTTTFMDWKIAGVIPEEHKPQMLAQLACTGHEQVDFFAYDPRIKEEKKRHLLLTWHPEPAEIKAIEDAAEQFLDEVHAMWEAFITA